MELYCASASSESSYAWIRADSSPNWWAPQKLGQRDHTFEPHNRLEQWRSPWLANAIRPNRSPRPFRRVEAGVPIAELARKAGVHENTRLKRFVADPTLDKVMAVLRPELANVLVHGCMRASLFTMTLALLLTRR